MSPEKEKTGIAPHQGPFGSKIHGSMHRFLCHLGADKTPRSFHLGASAQDRSAVVVRQPQERRQDLTVTIFPPEPVFGSMVINLKGH